jgi:stearoyl-CoA desaturase (delta-9 desaturase)
MERVRPTPNAMTGRRPRLTPLAEPGYGYADDRGSPYHPTVVEAAIEWLDATNFLREPARALPTACFVFHLATLGCLVAFFASFVTLGTMTFFLAASVALVTVYNTVWYHRYCTHRAFEFTHGRWTWLFLWTNPLFFREESYLFAHRQHHALSDKAGDPYGPHLGRVASYLAIESIQKYDPHITRRDFETLQRSIKHIRLRFNDYDSYRHQGSFESAAAFVTRSAFAQALWAVPIFYIGGAPYLTAWYAAVFFVMFAMRDFNWWGHGTRPKKASWEFETSSLALNQRVYGYLASEWHNNHHEYPRSANYGFLPDHVDLAFQIIRALHFIGIVGAYRDDSSEARERLNRVAAEPAQPERETRPATGRS